MQVETTLLEQTSIGFRYSAWPVRQAPVEPGYPGNPPGLCVNVHFEDEDLEFVVGVPELSRAIGESLAATLEDLLEKANRENEEVATLTAERDALLLDIADKNDQIEDLQSEIADIECPCSEECCPEVIVIEFLGADDEVASLI